MEFSCGKCKKLTPVDELVLSERNNEWLCLKCRGICDVCKDKTS